MKATGDGCLQPPLNQSLAGPVSQSTLDPRKPVAALAWRFVVSEIDSNTKGVLKHFTYAHVWSLLENTEYQQGALPGAGAWRSPSLNSCSLLRRPLVPGRRLPEPAISLDLKNTYGPQIPDEFRTGGVATTGPHSGISAPRNPNSTLEMNSLWGSVGTKGHHFGPLLRGSN